jgi:hypothetical protein
LPDPLIDARSNDPEEVKQMLNPLAIGVTLGGLVLDVVVPRPKPRVGTSIEFELLSQTPDRRTPLHTTAGLGTRSSSIASASM